MSLAMNYYGWHSPEQVEHAIKETIRTVETELRRAMDIHGKVLSWHDGYGKIQEEVDEFFDEVKLRAEHRNTLKASKEAIQIAAMSLRTVIDRFVLSNEGKGGDK